MSSDQPAAVESDHRRTSTKNSDNFIPPQITLVDRLESEASGRIPEESEQNDNGDSRSDDPLPTTAKLYKKITTNSLDLQESIRQRVAQQKYRRYGQERYETDIEESGSGDGQGQASCAGPDDEQPSVSYLRRGKAKAKELVRRKKGRRREHREEQIVVDVLWENQRGFFFFGVPRYSSNSLLPSDPKPWQNFQFRTSPVDIRNAQVPDPSWEWAWKSWYVDMSRDVDEEGWEYSFAFKVGFNWHGNHPWFHSFVRRRRWLRVRKRKDPSRHLTREKAHELTADYFTIHPQSIRTRKTGSIDDAASNALRARQILEETELDDMEIADIATLMRVLSKAALDRMKLAAVRKFIVQGGSEIEYLPDRMQSIMSLFIFQNSRRQLLASLIDYHDEAKRRKENLEAHKHDDGSDKQLQHEDAVHQADVMLKAVRSAEEQVNRLEYWSDQKEMAHPSEALHSSTDKHSSTQTGTEVRRPFANKQDASEPGNALHNHPEHIEDRSDPMSEPSQAGSGNRNSLFATDRRPSGWLSNKAKESRTWTSDDSLSLERFSTPAEYPSEITSPDLRPKRKERARIASLQSKLRDEVASNDDGEPVHEEG